MDLRKQISLILAVALIGVVPALETAAQSREKSHLRHGRQVRGQPVALSEWGGPDVRLTVRETVTDIQLSCAAGEIPGRLKVDKNGRFRALGSYTGGSHGPVRMGAEPKPEPVTYLGSIKGSKMILNIDFPGADGRDHSFSLEKGKMDGRFVRCY